MQERYLERPLLRRATKPVRVGDVMIGGDAPIVVQSMTTAHTRDIEKVVPQIIEMHQEGAEIVRLTNPTLQDAQAIVDIKRILKSRYQDVPLVADVHHNGSKIATEAAHHVDKVRINPGLYVLNRGRKSEYTEDDVKMHLDEIERELCPLIEACKKEGVALRLGANHGSLSDRIMVMYGDTPEGMVVSVMEYIQICEAYGFKDIVVSLKSSSVPAMQEANILMVKTMDDKGMEYPIHLGVTESGFGDAGRIRSSIGIGTLLSEGIGDTIRVSLAEEPVKEIDVCYEILQAAGLRRTRLEIIVCPTCGRTESDDVMVLAREIEERLPKRLPLKIGVMGCIVNGPGELREADYGYWAVGKSWELRKGEEKVLKVDLKSITPAVDALVDVIKDDGKWIESVPAFT